MNDISKVSTYFFFNSEARFVNLKFKFILESANAILQISKWYIRWKGNYEGNNQVAILYTEAIGECVI